MTAFEEWIAASVAGVMRDAEAEMCGPEVQSPGQQEAYHEYWRQFEQRVAVFLIQARAQELRHQATHLQLLGVAQMKLGAQLIAHLTERSSRLEAVAMKIAQPEGWPLQEGTSAEEPSRIIQ